MKYEFELTGETALLMHRDDIDSADALGVWRKDTENKNKSRAGDDRSPGWTWQTYLYHDGEVVTMPHENLMSMLREAATQILLTGKKTYKELSQSAILMSREHFEFSTCQNGNGTVKMSDIQAMRDDLFCDQVEMVQDLGFRLYMKRAKVGQSKHIRVRPRFDTWKVNGSLEVISDDLSGDVLRNMFRIAGERKGLGDWRPGGKTPGMFGRFRSEVVAI